MKAKQIYFFDVLPGGWRIADAGSSLEGGLLAAWEPKPDLNGSGVSLVLLMGASCYYAVLAGPKGSSIMARGRGIRSSDALRDLRKKAEKAGILIDMVGLEGEKEEIK